MLIISKGKGSTKGYDTSKMKPTERLESLYEKNHKYDPEVGERGMKETKEQAEKIYQEAKNDEG